MDDTARPAYRHRTSVAQSVFDIVRMLESHRVGESLAATAGYRLTWVQVRAFWFIGRAPGLSQRELGQALGQSAPNTSKVVARLTQQGFLRLTRDPADQRVQQIELTDRGHAVTAALYTAGDDLIAAAVSTMSREARADLDSQIEELRAAIEDALPGNPVF